MAVTSDDSAFDVGRPLPPPSPPTPGLPSFASSTAPDAVPAPPMSGVRPGDITFPWRAMLAGAWILAFFAYAAIWQASVQIGVSTWWIGPRAQPANVVIRVLPFAVALTIAMCVIYDVARVLRVSGLGVALLLLIAIPDFSRSPGLGIAEVTVAALVGIVTVAAASGRYRVVEPEAFGSTG